MSKYLDKIKSLIGKVTNRNKPKTDSEFADVEEILSPSQLIIKNFRKNKIAMTGIYMFVFVLIMVYIVSAFIPETELLINDKYDKNMMPFQNGLFIPFGTDAYGRNMFKLVLHGGRISLQLGFIGAAVGTTLGVLFGSIAGFYGGKVDNFIMRAGEIVRAIPFLPLVITLSSIIGSNMTNHQKAYMMMIIMGFLGWTGLARMLRGQILSVRESEFVLAAKLSGIKERNIIIKHIIPNVISIIIVSITLGLAGYIMAESGLAYLGFGVDIVDPSWGNLLNLGLNNGNFQYFFGWLFPAIFLFMTILSINFIGDGLRDAIDPKSNDR